MRVIDEKGEMIGILSRTEALSLSKEKEVDLVEISPKAVPPICRIIDYGKMLYALKKKEKNSKKSGKVKEVKGIRITFRIGPGDLERQMKKTISFLKDGNPVRIQLVMRGREKAHKDIAFAKIKEFIKSLAEYSALEHPPKLSGHQIIAIVKPQKSSSQ
jgi:translation initiation factor IF-3